MTDGLPRFCRCVLRVRPLGVGRAFCSAPLPRAPCARPRFVWVRARARLRALFSGRALGSSPRAARGSSQFAWGFFCPALLALRALRRACPLLGASPARYVGGYPHLLFPPPLCRRRRSVIIGAGLGSGARYLAPLRSRRAPCWGAPAGARGSGDEGISRQA